MQMTLRIIKRLLNILILISVFSAPVLAQNQQGLERSYYLILASIKQEQSKLDSLNLQLTNFAEAIDEAKKNKNSEQDKIKNIMAQALSLSDEIQIKNKSIQDLKNQLETHQKNLDNLYTIKIDSMQTLLQSDKFTGDKQALTTELREFTEKRMMISPVVQSFTFDPQKIKSIQSTKSDDPLEQAMLRDYLNNALTEITEKLTDLRNTKDELEEMVLLEEKTEEFLDGVDTEGFAGFAISSDKNLNSATLEAGNLADASRVADPTTSKIQAYIYLVNQLDLSQLTGQSFGKTIEPGSKTDTVSHKEYLRIVNQIEQKLLEYQTILTKKLSEN